MGWFLGSLRDGRGLSAYVLLLAGSFGGIRFSGTPQFSQRLPQRLQSLASLPESRCMPPNCPSTSLLCTDLLSTYPVLPASLPTASGSGLLSNRFPSLRDDSSLECSSNKWPRLDASGVEHSPSLTSCIVGSENRLQAIQRMDQRSDRSDR